MDDLRNTGLPPSNASPVHTTGANDDRRNRRNGLALIVLIAGASLAASWWFGLIGHGNSAPPRPLTRPSAAAAVLKLSPEQLKTVTIATVAEAPLAEEIVTEGVIVADDERVTPIFAQFPGRIVELFARPGQAVKKGDRLFTLEAIDVVQSENDLMGAFGTLNKALSQLNFTQIAEKRLRELSAARAISARDFQQAQNELAAAQEDVRSAQIALQAVRNRLQLIGKTEDEIKEFEATGRISTETIVRSPIDGVVIQRKAGLGQFLNNAGSDPAYILADLSKVWVIANVRETVARLLHVGQKLEFSTIAYPDRVFKDEISLIGATVNAESRRIPVRADIDNSEGLLRPQMFANVRIFGAQHPAGPIVPTDALLREGERTRLWVVDADNQAQLRDVSLGISTRDLTQIASGVKAGERIVTGGSLFIDRVPRPSASANASD